MRDRGLGRSSGAYTRFETQPCGRLAAPLSSGFDDGQQNCPGSPPDSRGPSNVRPSLCEEELRAPESEGNDLDIPQCWPVPFRTCARLVKPRDPSRRPPRVARSWTGLCEWPPRPSRGSNRSTVRCPLLFPDANSGLVGCLGSSDVEFDRGMFPGDCPSKSPTSPDNQGVCFRTGASSAVRPPLLRPAGPPGEPFLALKVRWPGALRGSAPRCQLCSCCFGGPPLRRDLIASCMPHPRSTVVTPRGNTSNPMKQKELWIFDRAFARLVRRPGETRD